MRPLAQDKQKGRTKTRRERGETARLEIAGNISTRTLGQRKAGTVEDFEEGQD